MHGGAHSVGNSHVRLLCFLVMLQKMHVIMTYVGCCSSEVLVQI